MTGMDNTFYDESTEQSRVKAVIVAKYFRAWSYVMVSAVKRFGGNRLLYMDLFCGRGRYNDGTPSTPLLILEEAIRDTALRQMLVTYFNDADATNIERLKGEIQRLPGIETLRHTPQVKNEVITGAVLGELSAGGRPTPTLLFADPWGYKGLSLDLIGSVLKNFGCDCIFFFNYLRINMALQNDLFAGHMDAIFGKARADYLRGKLPHLDVHQREMTIIEKLAEALREQGGKYVLPFAFHNERGERTSHHLIFVSKGFRGYELMKEIMATKSSTEDQGVPSFRFNPADERQPLLFELTRPLDELGPLVLNEFAGCTITVDQIYERHSVGRRFIKKNYQEVVKELEASGCVTCDPPASKRRKGTLAPHVKVTFPPQQLSAR